MTNARHSTDGNWQTNDSASSHTSQVELHGCTDLKNLAVAYLETLESGRDVSPEKYFATCQLNETKSSDRQQFLGSLRSIQLLHMASRNLDDAKDKPEEFQFGAECNGMLGRTLGDYRFVREIGRGGMGIVFEAEQISLRRRVAVKVLPPLSNLDQRHIDRFVAESHAAAVLRHSHIVPVYGVGCVDSIYFYSMPLIDTQPLTGPMTPQRVAELGSSVARALQHAHEKGIIHRDIKPSNLLLDGHGKAWVADFGLARSRIPSQLTATGAVVGTMRYMSPEQALGDSHLIDHRTDIYALGVTMYELLSGRCPYDSSDRRVFLAELERGEPASLRKQLRAIPVDLETIVLKSIAREPSDRYLSADALAEDLDRFQAGEVIAARRPRVGDRIGKWVRRNRTLTVLGIGAWATISVVALFAAVQLATYAKATKDALDESRSSLAEADAFYDSARQVVDHFAMRVTPQLAGVPGAADVRREVLNDTLHYYKAFMEQVANNPLRKRELATTQMTVARIAEQLDADKEAIDAYQQAIGLLAGLPGSQSDEALCWNNLGSLWERAGRKAWADKAFANACDCLQVDGATAMNGATTSRRLAVTLAARGNLWLNAREESKALAFLTEAAALQRGLIADSPLDSELGFALRHDLLVSLGGISNCYRRLDFTKSVRISEQCVDIARELAMPNTEIAPLNYCAAFQDVSVAFSNRIALLLKTYDIPLAIDVSAEQVALCEKYCDVRPGDPDALYELATAHNRLGRLYAISEMQIQQRDAFSRAHAILSSLVVKYPDNENYHASLATVIHNSAVLADRLGQTKASSQHLLEYQREFEWLQKHAPDLAVSIGNLTEREKHQSLSSPDYDFR
ncbi:MAG: serine/threonine-protein kinase [Aureliella sp.]